MIIVEPSRWPVIIVANYRTKSTALLNSIGHMYKVKKYGEPGAPHLPDRKKKFLNHFYSGDKNYVVKTMADQLKNLHELMTLLQSDCFKIKLTRKDILEQIVSHYISSMTKTWVQHIPTRDSYTVGIDYELINKSINYILYNNKELENIKIQFDIITTFEELGDNIPCTRIYKTTRPKNYNLIKKIIERVYEQR